MNFDRVHVTSSTFGYKSFLINPQVVQCFFYQQNNRSVYTRTLLLRPNQFLSLGITSNYHYFYQDFGKVSFVF
jgi:hypothetical protein